MRRADKIIVGFQASPPKLQTKRRVEEFNTMNHHRIDCETEVKFHLTRLLCGTESGI